MELEEESESDTIMQNLSHISSVDSLDTDKMLEEEDHEYEEQKISIDINRL